MRHSAIALSGAQNNSSNIQGRPLLTNGAPEPNPYRRNLRSRGSLELGPIGPTMQAGVFPRPLIGIFAVTERQGLIAKKSPPRWSRPSVSCGHVARHGGLGNLETEHQKLTMDPRRTPDKVVPGHPNDQLADFPGNPRAPTAPATPCSISPKR